MKKGDLVFNLIDLEMVLIVKKLSNILYQCFSPKLGLIEITKKCLIPQTPKNKLIKKQTDNNSRFKNFLK